MHRLIQVVSTTALCIFLLQWWIGLAYFFSSCTKESQTVNRWNGWARSGVLFHNDAIVRHRGIKQAQCFWCWDIGQFTPSRIEVACHSWDLGWFLRLYLRFFDKIKLVRFAQYWINRIQRVSSIRWCLAKMAFPVIGYTEPTSAGCLECL